MADGASDAGSAMSRVPLEIWTQIIREVHALATAHRDLEYWCCARHQGVDEEAMVWATCRRVSHTFKTATEAAFAQALLLPGSHKHTDSMGIRLTLQNRADFKWWAMELDRLVWGEKDGKKRQRAVWKPQSGDDSTSNSRRPLLSTHAITDAFPCREDVLPSVSLPFLTPRHLREAPGGHPPELFMLLPEEFYFVNLDLHDLRTDHDRCELSFAWVPALNAVFAERVARLKEVYLEYAAVRLDLEEEAQFFRDHLDRGWL